MDGVFYMWTDSSVAFVCNSEENLWAAIGRFGVGSRATEDVMDKV